MRLDDVLKKHKLIAIIRNVSSEIIIDYTKAIINGGVNFFEVALNSPDSLKQISLLRKNFGDQCYIGAGTAISVELAKKAIDAGAQFLLTPGTSESVFKYCASNNIDLLPGVLTPTDVAVSLEYGFKTMKLFPAGDMPENYIKSLKGPFNQTNYVAIGGVRPENIKQFLEEGYIGVGLSGSLMPKNAVAQKDWDACSHYIKNMVFQIREFQEEKENDNA